MHREPRRWPRRRYARHRTACGFHRRCALRGTWHPAPFGMAAKESEEKSEHKAARTGNPIEEPVFAASQDALRWSRFKELAPEQMFETVRDEVFPFIKSMRRTRLGRCSCTALGWTSKRWTLRTMFRAIPCWRGFAWSWGQSGRAQSLSGTKSAISSWNRPLGRAPSINWRCTESVSNVRKFCPLVSWGE